MNIIDRAILEARNIIPTWSDDEAAAVETFATIFEREWLALIEAGDAVAELLSESQATRVRRNGKTTARAALLAWHKAKEATK